MMQEAILLVILILLIYYIYNLIRVKYDLFSIENNTSIHTDIDGRDYYVHNKHENLQVAADMFAQINMITTDLINYVYNKYRNSPNERRKEVVRNLMMRYDVNNLRENSPLNIEKDTSYTINKGDIIAICIRSIGTHNQIHDIETILFVVIHEITHLSISAYDHPDEFWEVFKFMLIEAEEAGLYKSPNFAAEPREYCGIRINYNPRYDISIADI
jgi:hypothetical protein